MKSYVPIFCALAAALFAIGPSGAQNAEPPAKQTGAPSSVTAASSVTYEGEQPVTLQSGNLTVKIDSESGTDADSRIPVITGLENDRVVFTIRVEEAEHDKPKATARVARLDPRTGAPQIVFSAFTWGAHCCAVTRIATMEKDGAWRVISAPDMDGDIGYELADLAGDGVTELISYDNDFLYAFESYASSFAPTRIARLVGTDITDVTREPAYRKFLRERLGEMEKEARENSDLWHSNGFLGGWVAAKSLVGEVDDAWGRMLKSYDRDSDWDMSECESGDTMDKCPDDKLRKLTFPQALLKLMTTNDYPLPKNTR